MPLPSPAGIAEEAPPIPAAAAPAPVTKPAPTPDKSGLLHSAVAGRTDHLKVNVPSGGYVIPADVVSGIGEGNTLAGAKVLHDIFEAGAPPPVRAKGGKVQPIPILGAGGEYIVAPAALTRLFGSVPNGHKILDQWVVDERKKIAKEMLTLPGPVKQ